jgi:hypothetical protein
VGTSSAKTITLRNNTNAAVTINACSGSADFPTPGCVGSLGAGATGTFIVSFTPTVAGPIYGSLAVFHSASGSPTVISASGTGN